MTDERTEDAFIDFCQRFVRNYWDEIAQGPTELPGSEPCEMSLEELLSEITYQTFCGHDGNGECAGLFTLRMSRMNRFGEAWQFAFHRDNGRWRLQSATSETRRPSSSCNWLDDVYARWFRPFLDRIIEKSQQP
jgi:hypothetical protein